MHTENFGTSIDRDSEYLTDNYDVDIVPTDDATTPVGDNLFDNSDNSVTLMIWIYSYAIITAIIFPIYMTEIMAVIIIAAVVTAAIKTGFRELFTIV